MSKVAVLGSINIDLVVRCSKRPKPGETVFGSNHQIIPGGKGGNKAYAAAQLGADVSLLGCIGTDSLGDITVKSLEKVGVNLSAVERNDQIPTGAAFITLDEQGENTIVYSPSANNEVNPSYIRAQEELISNSDIIISNCEVPLESVEELIRLANKHTVKTMLNLAPCMPIPDNSAVWDATILVANEIEGAYYTGVSINTREDALKAANKLLEHGIEIAIITLGGDGSVAASEGTTYVSSAIKTDVVDTTAAGDTYIGAFGVEWTRSGNIQAAMDFSSCASGLAVSKLGAQSSIPSEAAVRRLLEEQQKI